MRTYNLHDKQDVAQLQDMIANKSFCFGFRGKVFSGSDDWERMVATLVLSDPDVMSTDGECTSVVSLCRNSEDSSFYRDCIQIAYKLEY